MKQVLAFIEEQKQEFTKLPLFKFMKDQSVDPRQRLGFAPCMAHFIMSFSDLNKYVFRSEKELNKIQELINEHTYEDEHHWPWYVTDLEKLGFNPKLNFTEALRFLWGEHTKHTRQLAYQISGYALQADPILKLVVIEAIEATGNVLFAMTTQVASELQEITQKEYLYFGQFHFHLETGHVMGTPGASQLLEEIQLTEETRQEAFELVEKVFAIFSEWTNELLAYAQTHNTEPAIAVQKHLSSNFAPSL